MADRVVRDPKHGLLSEYIAHIAKPLIQRALHDEELRRAKEEKKRRRQKYLITKYGRLWRHLATMMKSRRKRQQLRQRAAEAREKKAKRASTNETKLDIEQQLDLHRARVETRRKIGAALVERCWSQSIARVANESDS